MIDYNIYSQLSKLDQILDMLFALSRAVSFKGTQTMATLKDLQDSVAAEATVEASVITLLNTLSSDLQAAIAAGADPAALQAIVDSVNTNTAALSAAVVANTPAAPAPAPASADPAPADPAAP